MRRLSLTLLLLCTLWSSVLAQTGQWKAYLSYDEPTEIVEAAQGRLYVLASGGLYSYNRTDQELRTYDKTNLLNDCGISHIAWSQAARRLVIVYDNHNIDLLSPSDEVVNLADYKNKQLAADKTVYGLDISGTSAYLSTGFGIVQLNVAQAEVTNTYQLGFRVDYAYERDGYLYAASSTSGLYRGRLTANLLDKANWERVGAYAARGTTLDPDLLALVRTLQPGGPKYNYFGFMKMAGGTLYTCGGDYQWYRPACIQTLQGDAWTVYDDKDIAASTGLAYEDLWCLDIDPKDPQHLMAGGRKGLYEFRNGRLVKHYNHENAPIESFKQQDKEYELITGITYTADGNLWLLNSQAPTRSLLNLNASGQWASPTHPELMKLDAEGYRNKSLGNLKDMKTDSRGLVWFVNSHWTVPSLYAYEPSADALTAFTSMRNEDGSSLDFTSVQCVTEDLSGNMWVGTNVGPAYLAPDQITASSPVFTQVKVPRNDGTNYADYLLANVSITCMAVDAANRKWFGTGGSGVYLISAGNLRQIHHFTAANSKLLSDNIVSIAIDNATNEVYFGTDKGLCSFRSNARSASEGMTENNVYAYPNPVRPDYEGAITITGLDEDADVKIVSVSGALIYEGRASGGEYKWYGLDRGGHRVASGVYMVEVATAEGEKGVVCKIAIVR